VAYAHARGVFHRDLKPSNVMVGAFGEVQVMDWGLAKVLPRRDAADRTPQDFCETDMMTVRSGSGTDASRAGLILGTPSYMAPEQARGELEKVDERADVFGLGVILCEILTGKPPFGGENRDDVRHNAARGALADALRRLDTSAADSELISLARDCLAADRHQRPRDAGLVSARVTAYLAGVQDRLRKAELARVEAQARAEEERKRRRITVALAASVLLTAGVVGGGWTYLARQQQRLAAQVDLALREAELLRNDAERTGDDLTRWIAARDAAQAAVRLVADARDAATRDRMTALLQQVNQAQLKPGNPWVHADLGRTLSLEGKQDEAIDEFRTAIRIKPDFPNAHNNLGAALHDQGKLEEAIAEYRTAIRLKPDYAEAYFSLGLGFRIQGEFAAAVLELRKARDLAKANPELVQRIDGELRVAESQAAMASRLPRAAPRRRSAQKRRRATCFRLVVLQPQTLLRLGPADCGSVSGRPQAGRGHESPEPLQRRLCRGPGWMRSGQG